MACDSALITRQLVCWPLKWTCRAVQASGVTGPALAHLYHNSWKVGSQTYGSYFNSIALGKHLQ
jgi:hypothetical protein